MDRPGQFTHGKELPDEIDAGLVALKTRFGALVDPGPMIYIGYSQGAGLAYSVVMGLAIAAQLFAAVVVVCHVAWVLARRSGFRQLLPAWVAAGVIGAAANGSIYYALA